MTSSSSTEVATAFTSKVLAVLKRIPRGKVATYSQIAKLAGNPQAVRGVVWILHSSSNKQDLPWHRVINAKGRISFSEMSEAQLRQQRLLRKEGVVLSEAGVIDLDQFQWRPKSSKSV